MDPLGFLLFQFKLIQLNETMSLTPVQAALRVRRSASDRLNGRPGILLRGNVSAGIRFNIGETRSEDYSEENIVTSVRIRDFLIDVAVYALNGISVKPIPGDLISDGSDWWEVQPLADEQEYRRHDRDGLSWRVHTKKRGAVSSG